MASRRLPSDRASSRRCILPGIPIDPEDRHCRSRDQNISGVMRFCGRGPTSAARMVSAALS
ncbi:MAG: hypothetical protein ACREUF_12300, partial [Solimonas sp.]